MRLFPDDMLEQCVASLVRCGASEAHARALARATVTAEAEGNRAVGIAHLIDYLDALAAGRIAGDAVPRVEQVTPVVTRIDARGGMQHLGVEQAFDGLVSAAGRYGVAVAASHNGFTVGALSWFPRRLAERGLAALAFANAAPAVMPASGSTVPRFCTNPMAFAVPAGDAGPIVIDQSSTATALVAIRQAAERGERIPEGWALDAEGEPTTDPVAALAGVLLPFGGGRGANVALMVELMAAGLTGAAWSAESAPFNSGGRRPDLGFLLLALDPARTAGPDWQERLADFVAALRRDGAFVPGLRKGEAAERARHGGIEVDPATWSRVVDYGR